ncbi:universal stress protein UspA [Kocuria varians]|uniref:Universal stress protein UspA n=1 Tax=Kocuria varians TaxID=1272 RepID=A0A4Y4D2Q6_KOCVA|nr:universal stress protein [Kocuria varians]GEC98866.1 universal stress protein UspA [Kocuria varians]
MDAREREIVVGVDGSDQSYAALHWAAREARRRVAPLHVVTAYSVPMIGGSTFDVGYAGFDDAAMNRAVAELVADARRRVAELDVDVRSTVEAGDPSGVLVELSRDAQLLVLGSRGRGGLIGRLLGSVSTAVPAHAHCPVGIIPLQWGTEYRLNENVGRHGAFVDGVTVGSDGSEQASAAMLWAAEEAEQLGVPLHVVCAAPSDTASSVWLPSPVDFDDLRGQVRAATDASVAWLRGHFPGVDLTGEVVDGSPIHVLVERSGQNQLVVTGTRGHGGFAGMLLGSTSQGVLHNCVGPAMIIPRFEDPRLADRPDLGI